MLSLDQATPSYRWRVRDFAGPVDTDRHAVGDWRAVRGERVRRFGPVPVGSVRGGRHVRTATPRTSSVNRRRANTAGRLEPSTVRKFGLRKKCGPFGWRFWG